MTSMIIRAAAIAMTAAVLLCGGVAYAASDAPVPLPPTGGGAAPHSYEVEGFRSAHFGMTEAEVLRAIQADFGIKEKDVVKETNPIERTTILNIVARELVPDTGAAKVSYVLGYNTKKLVSVQIGWGAFAQEAAAESKAPNNAATLLQKYFSQQIFPKETVLANQRLPDGSLLVFRAVDEKGRLVQVIYGEVTAQKSAEEEKDKKKKDDKDKKPQTIAIPYAQLSYMENPNAPDIFSLKPGQF